MQKSSPSTAVALRPLSHIYETLAVLYITVLIVSNIASVKLVGVGSLVFDAGTILFPLAYIIGDIITEVYGFKKMRRLVYLGVGMLLLTSLTFWLVGMLPAETSWTGQEAYGTILGVVLRIVLGSVTAIFVGELVNSYVLARLKVRTGGKGLWGRLIGSSVVGNALDTVTFSVIAFAGIIPAGPLLTLMATVFAIKMLAEIILSPLTLRAIQHIKSREQIDIYEEPKLKLG